MYFVLLCLLLFETCDSSILFIKALSLLWFYCLQSHWFGEPKKLYHLLDNILGYQDRFCPWFHRFEMRLWVYISLPCKLEWDLLFLLRVGRITWLMFVSHLTLVSGHPHRTIVRAGPGAQRQWEWHPTVVQCSGSGNPPQNKRWLSPTFISASFQPAVKWYFLLT